MTDIGVQPYWELAFDKDGHIDPRGRDALLRGAVERDLTDLVVFSHGWNNDHRTATTLYTAFFAPFPALLSHATAGVRVGCTGVLWPSMRFTDEPVPAFPAQSVAGPGPGLSPETRQALAMVFPGQEAVLDRITGLLRTRPQQPAALAEFLTLVRTLTGGTPQGVQDTECDPLEAAVFRQDPAAVCERLADALEATGASVAELFGGLGSRVWGGALEALRQATYWEMKRRAGVVGRQGLGPALNTLARAIPALRIHLAGHSFGARLVSFALPALAPGNDSIRSVTLLQAAFSHYAFTPRLPFAPDRAGVLSGSPDRVRGPLVCCHSRHDLALAVLYPVVSDLADEDSSLLVPDQARWGALGHDGIRALDGCRDTGMGGALPGTGCVNVDVSDVVRHGGPPAGAHSDICHPELARLILAAGGLVG
ncbi:serine-threonine protein kinase [Streptomyces orinoci]|uniref:Serine-threonine protein kinase n=1 Tax=Streptomyces orinoci TaxID=67339 RepID=A0ABV3JWN7_STRON|nr:serine-threonine protein kinase [Streptomyces orinoci]